MYETEVKLRVDDLEVVRDRLRKLDARLKERVEDEHDMLFRSTTNPQALEGQVLRLRLQGTEGMLTWKGRPRFEHGIKIREELQTTVSDARTLREILSRLGYEVRLEFSKSREYWDMRGLTVSLDELPFGSYVEIEGDQDQLEQAVTDLGLQQAERVEDGYPQLAARWFAR